MKAEVRRPVVECGKREYAGRNGRTGRGGSPKFISDDASLKPNGLYANL